MSDGDNFGLRFSAMPPPESMIQWVDILPDGQALAEMLDIWALGKDVTIERARLATFMRMNAWHLIAGRTIIYKLSYYYPADVDTLILDLVEKGYKVKYQQLKTPAELVDALLISLSRQNEEEVLPIIKLKHYGE